MILQYCPTCGKPKDNPVFISTTTTTSTVWPFCQCPTLITFTASGTTALVNNFTWNPAVTTPDDETKKIEVPKAFQEAFSEGELEL